jgi:type II secretory pathway component GspD/PulD (secretin)
MFPLRSRRLPSALLQGALALSALLLFASLAEAEVVAGSSSIVPTTGTALSAPTQPSLPRQVLITATILEWTHDTSLDFGFTVSYAKHEGDVRDLASAFAALPRQTKINQGTSLFLDRIRSDSGNYSGVIQALEQVGKVKILSEPRVVVMCQEDYNQQIAANAPKDQPPAPAVPLIAKISSASRVPYETVQPAGNVLAQVTQFKDTSLQLTVSVEKIIQDKYMRMNLDSSVADLSGYVSVALNQNGDPMSTPQTFLRSIKNTVLVQDKSLFMSGILKTTTSHKQEQGAIWLSQIPVLGYLFKNHLESKTDQELVFLVTPRIIRN